MPAHSALLTFSLVEGLRGAFLHADPMDSFCSANQLTSMPFGLPSMHQTSRVYEGMSLGWIGRVEPSATK